MGCDAFYGQGQDGELSLPQAAKTLGIRVLRVDAGAGILEVALDSKQDFSSLAGNIQAGFLSAMLESTMNLALIAVLGGGKFAPTLSLNVEFHDPALLGKVDAIGRVINRDGEICFMSGELYQEGRLVATATATAVIQNQ